jgi:hypothetical protein
LPLAVITIIGTGKGKSIGEGTPSKQINQRIRPALARSRGALFFLISVPYGRDYKTVADGTLGQAERVFFF